MNSVIQAARIQAAAVLPAETDRSKIALALLTVLRGTQTESR
jgi:hypothetical protein